MAHFWQTGPGSHLAFKIAAPANARGNFSLGSTTRSGHWPVSGFPVLHRAPDAFGRRWHFDLAHAEFRKRVDHRICDGRQRADAAGFPRTLHAERIGLGGHGGALALNRREITLPP